jgi:hypothetical protein
VLRFETFDAGSIFDLTATETLGDARSCDGYILLAMSQAKEAKL